MRFQVHVPACIRETSIFDTVSPVIPSCEIVQPSPLSGCTFVIVCKWAETCRLRCMPRRTTTHQAGAHALSMITMTPPLVTSRRRRLVVVVVVVDVVSRFNGRGTFTAKIKNLFVKQQLLSSDCRSYSLIRLLIWIFISNAPSFLIQREILVSRFFNSQLIFPKFIFRLSISDSIYLVRPYCFTMLCNS